MLLVTTVRLEAQQLAIGSSLPAAEQSLTAADGSSHTLRALAGEKGLVVVFWANTCPWIDKYESRLVDLAATYTGRGVGFALVNANDPVAFSDDALPAMKDQAAEAEYPFPYLKDGSGAVAAAFGARRTPEVFVFDADRSLVYAGAIDDSPAVADQVSAPFLRSALEAVVSGERPSPETTNAIGCTIKFP